MIKENSKYKHCNHHHELTNNHEVITIDGEEIVANKDAKLLIQEMNRLGLKTRTHHVDSNGGFVGILLDNVDFEVKQVYEHHSTRTTYNGKPEILISWRNKQNNNSNNDSI